VIFIFTVPFIPLTLDQQLDQQLDISFLDQHGNKNALVFFGFRGCNDVCPMTLSILSRLLDSQPNTQQWPQVIFVDIDAESYNIDPVLLDQAIERVAAEGKYVPKAIISVDLFGLPADYAAICQYDFMVLR